MDGVFAVWEAEQAAVNKRLRDALQAERRRLEAERRALDSQEPFKVQQDKWAAELEQEKAARMIDVGRSSVLKVASFRQEVKEAEERYRDPSNIVQLNVRCAVSFFLKFRPFYVAVQVGGKKFETLRDTLTKVR